MVTLVQVGALEEGSSSSKQDLEICGEEGKMSSEGKVSLEGKVSSEGKVSFECKMSSEAFDTGDREGKDTIETDLESGRKGRGTRWKAGLLVHSQHLL